MMSIPDLHALFVMQPRLWYEYQSKNNTLKLLWLNGKSKKSWMVLEDQSQQPGGEDAGRRKKPRVNYEEAQSSEDDDDGGDDQLDNGEQARSASGAVTRSSSSSAPRQPESHFLVDTVPMVVDLTMATLEDQEGAQTSQRGGEEVPFDIPAKVTEAFKGEADVTRLIKESTILDNVMIPLDKIVSGPNSRTVRADGVESLRRQMKAFGWKGDSKLIVMVVNRNMEFGDLEAQIGKCNVIKEQLSNDLANHNNTNL
jgi:hypothetical protein